MRSMSTSWSEEIASLDLEAFRSGGPAERRQFAREMVAQLHTRGFFFLTVPETEESFYRPELFLQRYWLLFNEALTEQPFLSLYMNAANVFENGYCLSWFPKTCEVAQPIEAFMGKPAVWRSFSDKCLPPRIRSFLDATEEVYYMLYDISSHLLEALELAYGFKGGSLTGMFSRRSDGAVRFVKYHRPNSLNAPGSYTTQVSEPHVDKSFFSFNLGETSPGLLFLDGGEERLLPSRGGALLITSGTYSVGLTRHTGQPVRPFRHTVVNDDERVVGLGFVSPEGGLHLLPVEEWPKL